MELNCGSFCVKYILEKLGKKNIIIKPNMFWITELALFLSKNLSNDINLFYYNSNLMRDYYIQKENEFEGFKYIQEVISSNKINLEEKKLNISILKHEINISKYMIICVESNILNIDENMTGGHYVILEQNKDNELIMYNPKKEVMTSAIVDYKKVLELCKNYGSWRIIIKEEK